MSPVNSRAKGARYERKLAKILTEHGFPARRGQQFRGGPDSPDVILEDDAHPVHWESKAREKYTVLQLRRDLEKARAEAPDGKVAALAWHKNQQGWLVALRLEEFLLLIGGERVEADE